jgi:hypothetical protein
MFRSPRPCRGRSRCHCGNTGTGSLRN